MKTNLIILIAALVVLAVAGGAYVYMQQSNNQLAEEAQCVEEGGKINGAQANEGKVCCANLQLINDSSNEDLGGCITGFGSVEEAKFICTACSNGVCGLGENKCNCPADCQ